MRREAAALVIALGLLVSAGLVPDTARARADNEEALHRAVLLAGEATKVRVTTHDGRTLEGRLFVQPGDSVRVFGGQSGTFINELVATSEIQSLHIPRKPDKEPVRIGGFIGGQVASLIGYALSDVNTLYTTAAGTVIGYGVGFAVRDRTTVWEQLYPSPPQAAFVRAGWFVDGVVGAARVDDGGEGGIETWLLAGGAGLGVTLSPRFALALASGTWAEPDIIRFDAVDLFSTVGLRGYWMPGARLVLGAGTGAAVGEHNTDVEANNVTDWGWSVSGMLACEFRVGRTTLIGPAVSVDYMRFEGDHFDDVTLVTFALRVTTY